MKGGPIDYGWIIGVAAIVLIAVFWGPISGAFQKTKDKLGNKEQVEAGKIVFYDTTRWTGPEGYRSCAMCHAADFVPEPGKKIEMPDYKPGQPIPLAGVSRRLGSALGTSDELFNEISQCITGSSRLQSGKVSPNTPFMADLIEYVKRL